MQRIKKNVKAKKSEFGVSEVQNMIMEMDKERKEKFPDGNWDDSDSMEDEADVVKAEVSKIINETRALESGEQANAFIKVGYPFIEFRAEDETALVGIFNRIVFESKAKYANSTRYLFKCMEEGIVNNILSDARCVFFQCETKPVGEGYSDWPYVITHAYVAFLLPGTRRAIVVKINL